MIKHIRMNDSKYLIEQIDNLAKIMKEILQKMEGKIDKLNKKVEELDEMIRYAPSSEE